MSSGEHGQAGAGRLLAGRYRVVRQLGRGGMGVVYSAMDEVLGREVAVKELRTYNDSSGSELTDLRLRMQREARAAARIKHPGVIAVHDVAEDEGRPVIVMELVDGPSLDDVLAERGTLDAREAAGIGAKVLDALDAAHRAGVLHRDVKPGNVLLDRSGRVVLSDFGIATMEDPGDGATTRITQSGDIVGSLDYLAPERAQGQLPGPPSDVWSLGATLYAAVEGASPFRRTSAWSTLTAIVSEPLPEPRRAGPLAPVLRELMHKDPQARPDAQRARELLSAIAEGRPDGDAARASGSPATSGSPAAPEPAASEPAGTPEPRLESGTMRLGDGAPPMSAQPTAMDAPGFRPAPDIPGQPAQQGRPVLAAHSAGPGADGPLVAGGASASSGGRRRGRNVVAAAVAVAVLAGAGVAIAVANGSGGQKTDQVASDSRSSAPAGTPDGKKDDGRAAGEKAERSEPSKQPSKSPDSKPAGGGDDGGDTADGGDSGGGSKGPGPDSGSGTGDSGGSASDGGGSADGGSSGGGGEPAPAPVCHAIGGGKYNCTVWRTADSYDDPGNKVGTLNAGTNYFYCQRQGRRETYGQWTNTWWARTDDDSGNTGVFVSDVYIKGGDNDKPLPGLPLC
ncbi:protein kinase [Streptomyces sp. NPDC004647]|uniref:serine/threonine-protein kinase n=1 Tax=Streptomyces sp. NPDC004647 TaxID=3154671 RepID=UPI0033B5174C